MIISDNDNTFKAACESFNCYFIAAKALWIGGFYKSLIGLIKNVLKKILAQTYVNYQELNKMDVSQLRICRPPSPPQK